MVWWIVIALAILWLIGVGLHVGSWIYILLIAALVLVVVKAVRRQKV